jgi:hypothetical protein
VSNYLAPHATAEVRPTFNSKLGTLATLQAFDYARKNLSLGAAVRRRQRLRKARAGRAGGLPGPLLARAPAAPVSSGALCAARRCFWQYVWCALDAPFRVQHLLPCSSGKLHRTGGMSARCPSPLWPWPRRGGSYRVHWALATSTPRCAAELELL